MPRDFVGDDTFRKVAMFEGKLNLLVGFSTYLIIEKPECAPKASLFFRHIILEFFRVTPYVLCGHDEHARADDIAAVLLRIVEVNGEDGVKGIPVDPGANGETKKTGLLYNPTVCLPNHRRSTTRIFIFHDVVGMEGEGRNVFDIQSMPILPERGMGGECVDIGEGARGRRVDVDCGDRCDVVAGTDGNRLTIERTDEGILAVGVFEHDIHIFVIDDLPCAMPASECYKTVHARRPISFWGSFDGEDPFCPCTEIREYLIKFNHSRNVVKECGD